MLLSAIRQKKWTLPSPRRLSSNEEEQEEGREEEHLREEPVRVEGACVLTPMMGTGPTQAMLAAKKKAAQGPTAQSVTDRAEAERIGRKTGEDTHQDVLALDKFSDTTPLARAARAAQAKREAEAKKKATGDKSPSGKK